MGHQSKGVITRERMGHQSKGVITRERMGHQSKGSSQGNKQATEKRFTIQDKVDLIYRAACIKKLCQQLTTENTNFLCLKDL